MVGRIAVLLYLVAALAAGLFWALRQPFATATAATMGGMTGLALVLIVVPGIIPAMILAVGQLRPKQARSGYRRFALVIWVVLGAIMGAQIETGRFDP